MISLSDIPARGGSPPTPCMGVFLAALVTAPFWLGPVGLYQYLGIEVAIWILYAMGFNLLFGHTGLHNFGHGAYLGVGAYAFGLFQQEVAVSLWGGLAAAILGAVVAGALVGAFLAHRRGIYFALLSIAFGQVFWFCAIKLHWLTGGEDGLLGIPRPDLTLGFATIPLTDNRTL
jgi:branched-chain amino acid transport system permease protein